ncbi:MAG: carbohydrate ABC transporter permease [Flavobacteriaceae bacterium]|nr:carbohydrate ABC transporter permease [Flavobacteriaceae bacterium]
MINEGIKLKSIKKILTARFSIKIIGLIIVLFALFPAIWMVRTSLMYPGDALAVPPKIFFTPTLSNYTYIFTAYDFGRYLFNSITISVGAVVLALVIGTPAAYALSRFTIKRKRDIEMFFLSARMGLPLVILIAFFVQFRMLGLLDTHLALIIVYQAFTLPLVIIMVKGFIDALPPEIEESALIDGCSRLGVLSKITLPAIAPGLIGTAIFALIFCYNEFLFASILTSVDARTAPVAIYGLISPERGLEWHHICAGATLMLIPVLVLSLLVRKYLVRGLALGTAG